MLLWFLIHSLFAYNQVDQPSTTEIISTGTAYSSRFYTDQTGNFYFIDGHKLIKPETRMGQAMEYGSISEGMITSADVSNPYQILIFYHDFNKVVFLNNKLARLRPAIDLREKGIEQAILVCSSGGGGLWVYSGTNNRLVFFDGHLKITNQSKIFSSISGSEIKPVFMVEAQNYLYINVPGEGIMVFDRFASWLRTIPYTGPDSFQVSGGRIVFFEDGELLSIDINDHKITSLNLPPGFEADNVQLQPGRLYLQSGDEFYVFRVK